MSHALVNLRNQFLSTMSKGDIELRAVSDRDVTSSMPTHYSFSSYDDALTLQRLGKRPRLNRSFGFMSILGISCTALCPWESVLLTSVPTLLVGGAARVVWALVANWIGILSVYATLAELASIAPTADHWVSMLAPSSTTTFLAYLTAWLTAIAWQAIATSVGYLIATLLQGIIVLAQPSYVPQAWQTVLLIWAISLFCVMINSISSRILSKFEGFILIFHLVGFFGVLIPLVYLAPHNNASDVFTTFFYNGDWPSQGLVFLVGFPTMAISLLGADCAVHMSEEIQSAPVVMPRALIYIILINGALAFAIVIALLFCTTDLEAAVAAADTLFYPSLYIFKLALNSTAGAIVLASIVLILSVAASVGIYASASRMLWSFSRIRDFHFTNTWNSLPVNAIFVTYAITILLSLVVLGSAVALQALLSLVNAALFTSYTLVCGLLLWRRCTGAIRPYGPWKLPEPLGVANNIFTCLYSLFTLFWSFWPQVNHPTPSTFNWSAVVFGSLVSLSILWYFIRVKHYFHGPIKEI
ncbi:amino acid transporter [Biscogniauxia marginata]|nr:amino acid transporter [Biscogniauxia marginata]